MKCKVCGSSLVIKMAKFEKKTGNTHVYTKCLKCGNIVNQRTLIGNCLGDLGSSQIIHIKKEK